MDTMGGYNLPVKFMNSSKQTNHRAPALLFRAVKFMPASARRISQIVSEQILLSGLKSSATELLRGGARAVH